MTVSTCLTEQDWNASVRLARRWYYWPMRLVGDAHAYAFLYVGLAGASSAMLYPKYRTREILLGIPAAFVLGMVLLWLTHLLRRRRVQSKVRKHNLKSVAMVIHGGGMTFPGASLIRWSSFRSAMVGDGLLVLRPVRLKKPFVIPIAPLNAMQREELIATLRHNLGPRHVKEAPIRGSKFRPNVVR